MNKKILAVLTTIAVSLPAVAQGPLQLPKNWKEALQQKVNSTTFDNALNALDKFLLLTIPVTKQYFPQVYGHLGTLSTDDAASYRQLQQEFAEIKTYPSTAGCKAYALDEHWVMAGATCIWTGGHMLNFDPYSSDDTEKFFTGLVEPNPNVKDLKINKEQIPWQANLFIQPREHKAPHVILVRVPENTSLASLLKRQPKINILAFKNTTPADLQGGEFYINSARFGINATHKRTLTPQQTKSGVVTLKERTSISGVSTDPLAYIKAGKMRWVGVNQGVTELRYNNLAGNWDGKPSNEYFYFNEEDAHFIKETISQHDPAAWQRIEARKGLEIL